MADVPIWRRYARLFGPDPAADVDDELQFHLSAKVDDLVEQGWNRDAARLEAQRQFGDLRAVQETGKRVNREREAQVQRRDYWGAFAQDIRYAARTLRKDRGFAIVTVLILALGIGANTAIFSVLDSVMLRALPVPSSGELVLLTNPDAHGHPFGSQTGVRDLLTFWEFRDLRDHNDVFSGVLAADSELPKCAASVSRGAAGAHEESASVRLVSGDYFSTLGVTPVLGRMFNSASDTARGGAPFAVISYGFWSGRFARDPAVIGAKIAIHRTPFEIVAVAPPGFFGETVGQAPDIWVPLAMQDAIYPGDDLLNTSPGVTNQHMWLQVMGRRKPGVTLGQTQANLAIVFRRMIESAVGTTMTAEQRRGFLDQRLAVQAGAQGSSTLREAFGKPLGVLMVLVGLVLLIACANVANLLLARGATREREFALRLAIGAGRGRAIRQLLTESLLLAVPGAIAGFLLAQWADVILLRMVPGEPGRIQLNLHPDARILLFTTLVAVLTSFLFGLFPALHLTRLDLSEALKPFAGSATGGSVRRLPAGKLLVIAQVAVSLVMLVATGLFVHSLVKLSEVNLGYNRDNLLTFYLNPVAGGWKGASIARLHEQLLERISTVPGVRAVTLSGNGLFRGSESGDPIDVEGYTPPRGEEVDSAMDHVGPNYFSIVGIPLLMGREIDSQDGGAGERVAVVNQTFVRHFFAHTNPLGKRVRDTYPGNPSDMTVVGVVADAKYNSLREETPTRLYAPFFKPLWEHPHAVYEVRTFGDPASVASAVRRVVRETAPALPPLEIHTMSDLVDGSMGTDRLIARLSAVFGLLAVLLASIGLYGVMAWTFARRTREIGVRMALGARPGGVFRMVLRDTLLLVLLGIAIGIPLALAGAHLIQGMLFGLGGADPLVMALASILLLAVAAIAGFLPARRAARVDPMIALRHE